MTFGMRCIASLIERDYRVTLPCRLQIEFARILETVTDRIGEELTAEQILSLFNREFFGGGVYVYCAHQLILAHDVNHLTLRLKYCGQGVVLSGEGNDPVDAMIDALGLGIGVLSWEEQQSIGVSNVARTVAFVEIATPARVSLFGVGMHESMVTASLQAVLSAVNRALDRGLLDDSMRAAVDEGCG